MGNWEIIIPEAGTNLVTNPSFETGTTGYIANSAGVTIAQSSTKASRGAYSCFVTVPGSAANEGMASLTGASGFPVSASTSYTAAFDLNVNGSGEVLFQLYWYTGAGAFVSSNTTGALTSDGVWTRNELTATSPGTAAFVTVVVVTNGTVSFAFYVDGFQIEAQAYSTTYIDGDQPGCKWNGIPHASTSTRDQFEARGGRVYNLSGLGFIVSAQDGTGMPPVSNLSSPLALQPGSLFDGQTIQSRNFSLTGSIIGTSVTNFHSQKQALIKVLNVNTTTIGARGQPRAFRYTGSAVDKEIYAAYDGGLEFGLPIGWTEKEFTLRLLADDPFFYGVGEAAAALDTNDSATFNVWAGKVNGQWDNFGPPGGGGSYTGGYTIIKAYGEFIIGGNFTNFDGIANGDYIVKYDGTTYTAMGTGADGPVVEFLVGADGSLYAGGSLTTLGGTTVRGIGKWNGSAWSALGPPSSGGTVYAMLFDNDGNLWVGGDFTNWDGIANADYLVKWDGSAWSAIGTGADGVVFALGKNSEGTIYAAGAFATINGVSATRIAKWNGTTWEPLGSGLNGSGLCLAFDSAGDLYAGFNGTTAGGVTVNYIGKWNGSSWSALADGLSDAVHEMAFSPDGELYAGGYFTNISTTTVRTSMAIWNGSKWRPIDHLAGSAGVSGRVPLWDGDDFYYAFYSAGTFTYAGTTTISYTGTERAYPYIRIKRSGGTAANLQTVTNETTGAGLLFDYSLADGEELVIDTRPGKQSIISSFRGNVFNELLPNSDFGNFYLTPGNGTAAQDNIITAFVSTAGSPTITANMIWKDAYSSED